MSGVWTDLELDVINAALRTGRQRDIDFMWAMIDEVDEVPLAERDTWKRTKFEQFRALRKGVRI